MSTSVPAALIRGVWYDMYPKDEFPVSFKYMKSLCNSVMTEFSDKVSILFFVSFITIAIANITRTTLSI